MAFYWERELNFSFSRIPLDFPIQDFYGGEWVRVDGISVMNIEFLECAGSCVDGFILNSHNGPLRHGLLNPFCS